MAWGGMLVTVADDSKVRVLNNTLKDHGAIQHDCDRLNGGLIQTEDLQMCCLKPRS